MDKVAILTELRAAAANVPDFGSYAAASRPHLEWIGKTDALLCRWDRLKAIPFMVAAQFLGIGAGREMNVGKMLALLHYAIGDLEQEIPTLPPQAFGPGAVYDFHKTLRDLLSTATTSLFIVDPYLDDQIFDAYLSTVSPKVDVRLLARQYVTSLRASVQKFVAQNKMAIEVRISNEIHDRVIFIDGGSCWVLGQSIKDAAKRKPTYLAPLAGDTAQLKRSVYDQIWESASQI